MGLDIRYARSGGVSIAYQVVGDGDTDLVCVPDWVSNLVYGWEWPRLREFYLRLASFSRFCSSRFSPLVSPRRPLLLDIRPLSFHRKTRPRSMTSSLTAA